jgi:hypothetical protein
MFESARHQPLGWVHRLVPAGGQCHFVLGVLELAGQCGPRVVIGVHDLLGGSYGGLHRLVRLAEKFSLQGLAGALQQLPCVAAAR